MNDPVLGILGGLGPMSGVYFCEMLISHTKASGDQDHLNFLLSSRADTPDRTDFILGRSDRDPTPVMIREAQKLIDAGADVIAIPCNTAHYFYKSIALNSSVPVLNIIEETAAYCRFRGLKKVGVLSTRGTSSSGSYKNIFDSYGIEYDTCNEAEHEIISDVIYNNIKKGSLPKKSDLMSVANALQARGCQAIVLGCTELSLLKKEFSLKDPFIDSLEVLALCSIIRCNKEPVGFDPYLMKFHPERIDIK